MSENKKLSVSSTGAMRVGDEDYQEVKSGDQPPQFQFI